LQILPAIDILSGSAVRLRQGDYDAVTVYNEDPVDQARIWAQSGAEWIHVVDLDGAREGVPRNTEIIGRIVASVDVPVQAGGGIRDISALDSLFAVGVKRCVLGTSLVKRPEFVVEACAKYSGIVAGVDARDGKVAIEGWREGTEHGVLELVRELELLGVQRVVYTDISRDGMREGIDPGAYRVLASGIEIPIIASGGVSSLAEIRDLASIGPNIEGAIVGVALYEGHFTLEEAIAAARGGEA